MRWEPQREDRKSGSERTDFRIATPLPKVFFCKNQSPNNSAYKSFILANRHELCRATGSTRTLSIATVAVIILAKTHELCRVTGATRTLSIATVTVFILAKTHELCRVTGAMRTLSIATKSCLTAN